MAQRKYMIFVKDWLVNIFPVCLLFVVSEAPVEMQGSFFMEALHIRHRAKIARAFNFILTPRCAALRQHLHP